MSKQRGKAGATPRKKSSTRRSRRQRSMAGVPTMITLGNLVAGFAAIYYAARPLEPIGGVLPGQWTSLTIAGALIFLGIFLDAIDGSIARLTRSFSDIGAQLDSLADLVTFGIAPAFMMLRLVSYYVNPEIGGDAILLGPDADDEIYGKLFWGIAATYVCCSAMRLARFNVDAPSVPEKKNGVFHGMPTPAAAGAVASLIVVHQHWLYQKGSITDVSQAFAQWSAFGIPLVTLLCAVAMVSSIPYVHFMNRYIQGERSFPYLARIVVPLVLMVLWLQEVLAIAFTLYAVTAPLKVLFRRMRRTSSRPSKSIDSG